MEPKILSVKHNAEAIGEILKVNSRHSVKSSKYKFKTCDQCKSRPADSIMGLLCHVCFRKIEFSKLPDQNKEHFIADVVPKKYLTAKLDDLAKSLRAAVEDDTETGVLLWGPPGVGKTYALCAAARHFLEEGYIVSRINYEYLCLKLRDTFKPTSRQSEWEVIEPLVESDKLIIEDIGTTRSIDSKETDFSLRTLLLLLDMRIEECKPTYITTNKTLENLQSSFDGRVGDRLRTFNILRLAGKSKRK